MGAITKPCPSSVNVRVLARATEPDPERITASCVREAGWRGSSNSMRIASWTETFTALGIGVRSVTVGRVRSTITVIAALSITSSPICPRTNSRCAPSGVDVLSHA